MRWALLLVALCACNNVFGLDSTELVDAAQIDAPSPAACPPFGTLPTFEDALYQVPAPYCQEYSTAGDVAMAECQSGLARGEVDQPLTTVITSDTQVYQPRLAPDGNHVFVERYNTNTATYDLVEMRVDDSKAVEVGSYTPPMTYAYYFSFTMPSRGPDRRILYTDYNYTTAQFELVEISDGEGNGKWQEVARYPLSDVGGMNASSLSQFSLTADGRRLLFIGYTTTTQNNVMYYSQKVMYSDRASLSDHFGPAQVLDSVPEQVAWPWMTEDCGRIYFSALNRVFYLKQPQR